MHSCRASRVGLAERDVGLQPLVQATDPEPARAALALHRPYVLTVASRTARKNLAALDAARERRLSMYVAVKGGERAIENAHRLLNSKERDAFDLTKEPKESYEKYNVGRFGLGCLLARRLAESGAQITLEQLAARVLR